MIVYAEYLQEEKARMGSAMEGLDCEQERLKGVVEELQTDRAGLSSCGSGWSSGECLGAS